MSQKGMRLISVNEKKTSGKMSVFFKEAKQNKAKQIYHDNQNEELQRKRNQTVYEKSNAALETR